jgi:hypothetical protein
MFISRRGFVLAVLMMGGLRLWSQEEVAPAISMEEALKLGVEGIATKLKDESEAGLDSAAYFYATAKRLQTEQALGAKDLRLVSDLESLRVAAGVWLDAWYGGMYHVSGGGTMWGHLQTRCLAELEDTLAELAKRMPLKPGNATAETLTRWGKLEKAIAKAKVFEEADAEMKAMWKTHQKVMHEKWERLNYEFQALDDADVQLLLKVLMPGKEEMESFSGN